MACCDYAIRLPKSVTYVLVLTVTYVVELFCYLCPGCAPMPLLGGLAGILTTGPQLVVCAVAHVDSVWMGRPCRSCRLG